MKKLINTIVDRILGLQKDVQELSEAILQAVEANEKRISALEEHMRRMEKEQDV